MEKKVKDIIVQIVNEHQGIKATELVVEVAHSLVSLDENIDSEEYDNALTDLVESGDIVELEYTLPSMDYRVKSLYFPKETVIVVSKAS